MSDENHAETIERLTLAAVEHCSIQKLPDGRTFAFVPMTGGAVKLENITQEHTLDAPIPKYVKQSVQMQTAASMILYINRFKNKNTVLFADINRNSLTGIIDYHHEAADEKAVQPELGTNRATLALPFSEEWNIWNKASGVMMSHLDFATFLEENGVDVVTPAGADLLELCRDLQGTRNVKFGSVVRAGDYDKIDFQRESGASTKGGVDLPVSITLSIPVYFGGDTVQIVAFLRRKVDDNGGLTLGIKLSRAEQVRQNEFHRVMDDIDHATEVTLVYGSPA